MGPYQVLSLQVRVDLEVMAMLEYFTFHRARASPSDGLILYPGYVLVWFLCLMAYQPL